MSDEEFELYMNYVEKDESEEDEYDELNPDLRS